MTAAGSPTVPTPTVPTPTALATAAWPAVPEAALVLLPIGSTEQHGPQLPFDTDTAIAAEVARRAARHLAEALGDGVVLAPALGYGASGEHQHFPGTLSLGTEALHRVVVELARSLRTWAPRLVIVNGHGGNVPALAAATAQLAAEGHDAAWVPCGLPGGDAHAGGDETSMMLRLRPEAVGSARPVGVTEPIGRLLPRLEREGVRAVAPDGVLGDARGASADRGERLLAAIAASAVRRIAAAVPDERGCLRDPDREPTVPA